MSNKRVWGILIALILVLVFGGLWWWLGYGPTTGARATPWPTAPPVTPPPSLDELALLYPEIADLLANGKLASVYKELLVVYQQGGLDAAEELARQRGLLNEHDEIRLILVLDTQDSDPLVAQLQAAGVRVENYYGDLVAVAVPLERISEAAAAGDPGAALRQLTELEHVIAIRLPESAVPQAEPVTGGGVAVVGADEWHSAGFSGLGLKVAVLDGAFEGYEDLLGTELPADVTYQSFGEDPGMDEDSRRHGTACAEIVHEIAPDAELYLIAFDGEIGFAQAVDWIIAQGIDVVSFSMSWLAGPRDGTGREAQLVDKAEAAGVLWVGSAGNYALSHYAAFLVDSDDDNWHEFSADQQAMPFLIEEPGQVYITLYWDGWPRSDQDLDLYVTDVDGNTLASSRDLQDGTQYPYESIHYHMDPGIYYLAVEAATVTREVHFDLFMSDGEMEEPVPEGSLGTPADAQGCLTVGATYWRNDLLEPFSSQGPTTDGRTKPDLAAPDGVKAATYSYFYGTSAAAPHVAGAAALVWGAFPEYSPRELTAHLQNSALDLGPSGADNRYGAGRLALGAPPGAEPAASTPTDTPSPSPTPTSTPPSPTPTFTPPPSTLPPSPPGPTPTLPPTPPTPTPTPDTGSSGNTVPPGVTLTLVLGLVAVVFVAVWFVAGGSPPRWVPHAFPLRRQARACSRCGYPARPGSKFCLRCGSSLAAAPKRCPHCGQLSRSSQARYCGACGNRLR